MADSRYVRPECELSCLISQTELCSAVLVQYIYIYMHSDGQEIARAVGLTTVQPAEDTEVSVSQIQNNIFLMSWGVPLPPAMSLSGQVALWEL